MINNYQVQRFLNLLFIFYFFVSRDLNVKYKNGINLFSFTAVFTPSPSHISVDDWMSFDEEKKSFRQEI